MALEQDDANPEALGAAAAELRAVAAEAADRDRDARLARRLRQAGGTDASEEAIRAVLDAELLPDPSSLLTPSGRPLPDPIIATAPADDGPPLGTLLGEGELGLLSGSGGGGKSSVTLELAIMAKAAELQRAASAETAVGLHVAPGGTLIATYEDSAARLEERTKAMIEAWRKGADVATDALEEGVEEEKLGAMDKEWLQALEQAAPAVYALEMRTPLWASPEGSPHASPVATAVLGALMREAERRRVRLLVVDPLSAAFAGSANDAASVRGFMAALSGWARESGIAVLGIAHDTKNARGEFAREGADAGAAAVSGSAQWFDASRSVLWMAHPEALARPTGSGTTDEDVDHWRDCERERRQRIRRLSVVKANYGPTGWERQLGLRTVGGRYAGWAVSPGADQNERRGGNDDLDAAGLEL